MSSSFPHVAMVVTFVLVNVNGGRAIRCLVCGLRSWHQQDVEHRYCVMCHRFHDEMAIDIALSLLEAAQAGVPRDSMKLLCQECDASELVKVSHFTQVYKTMNDLGWTLIPTQHGSVVSGLCPKCNKAPREIGTGVL